jgi:hypothetical protein
MSMMVHLPCASSITFSSDKSLPVQEALLSADFIRHQALPRRPSPVRDLPGVHVLEPIQDLEEVGPSLTLVEPR